MLPFVVIAVVSLALVVGAAWGVMGPLNDRVQGFVVALAGGALIVSVVLELIGPAADAAPAWAVAVTVLTGAATYVALARWIARRFGRDSGGGLLAAIVLDGVPENLALGVALIGAGPLQVAALSGSILLSNLPEAAGGAREMNQDRSTRRVIAIWGCTAILLAGSAVAGYLLLADVSPMWLALVKALAGGAVVASLATTVFPDAFEQDSFPIGLATAAGLLAAIGLDRLG